MSQIKPTGRAHTLPLLAKTGQLIILGTVINYGSMSYKEVVSILGDLKAHRVVKELEQAGWVVKTEGILTFGGSTKQLAAMKSIVKYGYTPLLDARDRVRSVDPNSESRVLVIGSFAARLNGEAGLPPGDVDILVLSDDVQADREVLGEAIENYSPVGQLELHTIVRTRKEVNTEGNVWFTQLQTKPWLSLSDLPEGVICEAVTEHNADADPAVVFASASRMRVIAEVLHGGRMNLTRLGELTNLHRTQVARHVRDLSGWLHTETDAGGVWVTSVLPDCLTQALVALLPVQSAQAKALLQGGASSVWAYGEYASWLLAPNGKQPLVQLVAVNELGFSGIEVGEILNWDDSKVLLCNSLEWEHPSSRPIVSAQSGVTVKLS